MEQRPCEAGILDRKSILVVKMFRSTVMRGVVVVDSNNVSFRRVDNCRADE